MKAKLPRVLVDMDGVVCNLMNSWFPRLNQLYGVPLDKQDLVVDMETFTKPYGVTREQFESPFREEGFWLSLEPQDDVLEYWPLISKICELVIVTKQNKDSINCAGEKQQWVRQNLGEKTPFIATKHKYMVKGDILIDDHPENIYACKKEGLLTICYDQVWNQKVESDIRVYSWRDIYYFLLGYVNRLPS